MIHIFVLLILLCFISRKVTASQELLLSANNCCQPKWRQDKSGFHPKVSVSHTCVPAKSGCHEKKYFQSKAAAIQKWLTSQESMPAIKKKPEQNGCYPKAAVSQNLLQEKMYNRKKWAANQKQQPAKCQCKPKLANSVK